MKRGDIFTHAYWLDTEHKPLVCRVTKTALGLIYYRPVDGGSPVYFRVEDIAKYVKECPDTTNTS